MATTTAQLEAKLGSMDFDATLAAAVTHERTGIQTMSPTARLLWLAKALEELQLDTGFLASARGLAARATDLQRRATERQLRATKSRGEALQRLVADPAASLDEVAAQWLAASPWLDTGTAQRPPAIQLAHDAGRRIESQIDGQIAAGAAHIFTMLQGKARDLVAEVESLPPFPKTIWLAGAGAADELGRTREHRATWGVLSATNVDFESVHKLAELVRDHIGAGPDSLPDGAPRSALVFRNWRAVLDDQQLNRLKKELRLRYAIEHGFEPGLWRPEDIKTTEEDRTFRGKLRNLGQAVGVVGSGVSHG